MVTSSVASLALKHSSLIEVLAEIEILEEFESLDFRVHQQL
jgi:hypothetical protein